MIAPAAPSTTVEGRWTRIAPFLLVLLAIMLPPIGGGIAKHVAVGHDILGLAFLRNAISAAALLVIARPRLRGLTGAQWRVALGLGAALALMNATFYLSITRLPLGVAVAVEFIGPLTVAMLGGRRWLDFLWPLLALGGVLLLTPLGGATHLDPLGLFFAATAGAGWAAYILTSQKAGQLIPGMTGLALALTAATLFTAPVGLMAAGPFLTDAHGMLLVLGVALFSTLLPYMLEYVALRRVPTAVFGILLALEPAIAALVGVVGLGERLGLVTWTAIAMVCTAALGSSLLRPR